jgi:hypothetical protein
MKTYLFFLATLLATAFAARVGAQSPNNVNQSQVDENIARKFASAVSNGDVMIGVFELPEAGKPPVALKSGVVPEALPGYSEAIIAHNLIKMNLVTAIKGNFDNVIFVKRINPTLSRLNGYVPPQIIPYSGTTWIVIVRKATGSAKGSAKEWVAGATAQGKGFLNENTLFEFAEEAYGALCLEWSDQFDKPADLKMASREVVSDLKTIVQAVNPSRKESPEQLKTDQGKAAAALSSPYGKAIGKAALNQ